MPKSRKRKGARRYRPKFNIARRMDPAEALGALNAKSLVLGAQVREAMSSQDTVFLEKTLADLKEASEEAHDFARTPMRKLMGPSMNKARQ